MVFSIANHLLHFLFHCGLQLLLRFFQLVGSAILNVSSGILQECAKTSPDFIFLAFLLRIFIVRILAVIAFLPLTFIVLILAVIVVILLETAHQ